MRYEVIRYPQYFVVIDHGDNRKIVAEYRTKKAAHKEADRLQAIHRDRLALERSHSKGSY